ncbi:MAG TPA: patatin-like phospholipase family protein, partial [Roseiflexaceae bacterium]
MTHKTIAIACQGGGSHTAFTAGALKVMLRELDPSRYRIVGLSGTSGGAMCALLAWYGLLIGDRAKGAQLLDSFWGELAAATPWDEMGNDVLVWLNRVRDRLILPEISPYWLPPLGQERLSDLLNKHVPFERLQQLIGPDTPTLLVGAVDVLSGKFVVFRDDDPDPERRLSVGALLASAAIPSLFRATPVGDHLYWDGLFSENPPIRDFVAGHQSVDAKPDEIWVIQINPETAEAEPKTVKEIEDR